MKPKVPKRILDKIKTITGKRSRIVVDHILRHGSVTTEDLEKYGYKHPPRAIRDVKEQGLPLRRTWTKSSDGRKIARYFFGDPRDVRDDRLGGRRLFAKKFTDLVIAQHGSKCAVCQTEFEDRYLQIDHRIPYEIEGDIEHKQTPSKYMPLCGSCNRAKSWSCEHCENWHGTKSAKLCRSCYWAAPADYRHVALREIRRLDVVWSGAEVKDYERLASRAGAIPEPMPSFVKDILKSHLARRQRRG